ncbi:MAG: VOC family protein [Candidatus Paceibacterota bacterium]
MENYDLKLHHFGLASADFEKADRFLTRTGYLAITKVQLPNQGVALTMYTKTNESNIETITKVSTPSVIDNILKNGGMIYHICYTTKNVKSTMDIIKKDLRVIPVSVFDSPLFNKKVYFYQIQGFGLIEIFED